MYEAIAYLSIHATLWSGHSLVLLWLEIQPVIHVFANSCILKELFICRVSICVFSRMCIVPIVHCYVTLHIFFTLSCKCTSRHHDHYCLCFSSNESSHWVVSALLGTMIITACVFQAMNPATIFIRLKTLFQILKCFQFLKPVLKTTQW